MLDFIICCGLSDVFIGSHGCLSASFLVVAVIIAGTAEMIKLAKTACLIISISPKMV